MIYEQETCHVTEYDSLGGPALCAESLSWTWEGAMSWVYLALTIAIEISGTVALKMSEGFANA